MRVILKKVIYIENLSIKNAKLQPVLHTHVYILTDRISHPFSSPLAAGHTNIDVLLSFLPPTMENPKPSKSLSMTFVTMELC
jgi:hypothetical protein